MAEHQVSDYAAAKIRDLRKQRGWTTADLASRCGLTDNIIENIEGGRRASVTGHRRRGITADELVAISEALGAGVLDLLPDGTPGQVGDLVAAKAAVGALRDELAGYETAAARIGSARQSAEARLRKAEARLADTERTQGTGGSHAN